MLNKLIKHFNLKTLRTSKKAHAWVLFALLAFVAQSGFAAVYSSMMFSTDDNDTVIEATLGATCHDDMVHQTESPQIPDAPMNSTVENCCEDRCAMMACHSICVLLSSVALIDLSAQSRSEFISYQAAVIKPATFLYRPPILG